MFKDYNFHIEEIFTNFLHNSEGKNKEITNLPITLKKIVIKYEKYLKYITKIPFGCIVETLY
jgi:hypothetical protein